MLLQRRISHGLTLPTPRKPHNSPPAGILPDRYAGPVAIFGRMTARNRLRRATQESLTIPAFSAPVDCTHWLIGEFWPAELSTTTGETSALAKRLRDDLERIADSANNELMTIRRSGMTSSAQQAQEARVIDVARALAQRRVESTMHHVRGNARDAWAPVAPGLDVRRDEASVETGAWTVGIPAPIVAPSPATTALDAWSLAAPGLDVRRDEASVETGAWTVGIPAPIVAPSPATTALDAWSLAAPGLDVRRDEASVETGAWTVGIPAPIVAPSPATAEAQFTSTPEVAAEPESDGERLRRLLAFVTRQEPRLSWAVGDQVDGTTLLVTDLVYGWIPPGITLPEGVRLLEPERRASGIATLTINSTRSAKYAPGDSLTWSADFVATKSSIKPRELQMVDDLGRHLAAATNLRNGLPRTAQALARAAAGGTDVADDEIDLLRVHVDTALCQVLVQYPETDPALLLNCLLLAATECIVTGDPISANYHFSWFQKLDAQSASGQPATL